MTFSLKPAEDDDETMLPLGFQAGEDFERGGMYQDEYGYELSPREIDERLDNEGLGRHEIGVFLRYRMPQDAIDAPFRSFIVTRVVEGSLDRQALGRIVHEAARSIYKTVDAGGVVAFGTTASETPAEVFVEAITVE